MGLRKKKKKLTAEEKQRLIDKLGRHLSAGKLTASEYRTEVARVRRS